jgi:D-arabinose 1-dehydrogenase-like Zn-dependent alcohol dehydrogenase
MGFGGSNHLVLKVAKHKFPNSPILVFSRNAAEREFALSLGAAWAGAIDHSPPEALDAAIDTTPVWGPVSEALKRLKPGGRLVINAIRKEEVDKEVAEARLSIAVVDGEGDQIGCECDPRMYVSSCSWQPMQASNRNQEI